MAASKTASRCASWKQTFVNGWLWPAAAVCGYGPATASTCAAFFRQPCKQSGKVKRVTIRKFDGITVRFHSLDADAAVWIKPNEHFAAGQSMDNHVLSGHASSLRVRVTPVAYPIPDCRERLVMAGCCPSLRAWRRAGNACTEALECDGSPKAGGCRGQYAAAFVWWHEPVE